MKTQDGKSKPSFKEDVITVLNWNQQWEDSNREAGTGAKQFSTAQSSSPGTAAAQTRTLPNAAHPKPCDCLCSDPSVPVLFSGQSVGKAK